MAAWLMSCNYEKLDGVENREKIEVDFGLIISQIGLDVYCLVVKLQLSTTMGRLF